MPLNVFSFFFLKRCLCSSSEEAEGQSWAINQKVRSVQHCAVAAWSANRWTELCACARVCCWTMMSTLKVFELQASFELKERYKSLSHDSMEGGLDITHTRTHRGAVWAVVCLGIRSPLTLWAINSRIISQVDPWHSPQLISPCW